MENVSLSTAHLKPEPPSWRRAILALWTALGLLALLAFVWSEPFSGRFFGWTIGVGVPRRLVDFAGVPLVMALRGVLLVEAFGYVYHRFFQHVGFWTRRAQAFRRNQMYHWVHHMIIYPIGRLYKKAMPYVDSEEGIAWSWVAPTLGTFVLAFVVFGFNAGTIAFVAGIAIYARMFVQTAHERFHVAEHPWMNSPYFHWLEDIHVLHHWDQRTNFTIVHPLMDILFGTYLSPSGHRAEIETALRDEELTVSDFINWRYLLKEASPSEYAAFISQAKRHPESVRKLDRLMALMDARLRQYPSDAYVEELRRSAAGLLSVVRAKSGAPPSSAPEPAAA